MSNDKRDVLADFAVVIDDALVRRIPASTIIHALTDSLIFFCHFHGLEEADVVEILQRKVALMGAVRQAHVDADEPEEGVVESVISKLAMRTIAEA